MILTTANERSKLLRAHFTGKQIEALYCVLNRFEEIGVDWHEAATKLAGAYFRFQISAYLATCSVQAADAGKDGAAVKPAICFLGKYTTYPFAGTQAAPPQGVRA